MPAEKGNPRSRIHALPAVCLLAAVLLLSLSFLAGCGSEPQAGDGDEDLVAKLASEDQGEREAAADALVEQGGAAVQPLVAAFSGDNQDVDFLKRVQAVLVRIGEPAVQPLVDSLGYSGNRSSTSLAWKKNTLVQIGAPAVEPLKAALANEDPRARKAAADTLGKIGDPAAVSALAPLLDDEDREVRLQVAESLGAIADPAAIEPLVEALATNDYGMQQAIERSLALIKEANGPSPALEKAYDACIEITVKPLTEPIGLQLDADGNFINPEAMNGMADDDKLRIVYAVSDCVAIKR